MDAFHSYGAPHQSYQTKPLIPGAADARPRLSAVAAMGCLLGACSLFAMVSSTLSFSLHYESPSLCWFIVCLAFACVVACCYFAYSAFTLRMSAKTSRDPTFYMLLAISMSIAWGAGVFLGNDNYWRYTRPFNDALMLSTYTNVDVGQAHGQQMMDAGRVTFVEGTHLDLTRSMGFKNFEQYCVVPIASGDSASQGRVYDFWAVGMNCCSGNAADFHCGEYDNIRARSGLRLLREEQRPFYRLAVRQAEATFGISAPHPLFFDWAQDADAEAQTYQDDAMNYFLMGLMTHFVLQLLLVLVSLWVYSKNASV